MPTALTSITASVLFAVPWICLFCVLERFGVISEESLKNITIYILDLVTNQLQLSFYFIATSVLSVRTYTDIPSSVT